MSSTIVIAPCEDEPELRDPSVAGAFANAMASIGSQLHLVPWCGYIGRREGVPVGFGGFGGFASAPDQDGQVEIGYLAFPVHAGTGVATEITAALVAIARSNGLQAVIANTLAEPNGSTRVLEKNGFVRDGTSVDPDEGEVWRWKLEI